MSAELLLLLLPAFLLAGLLTTQHSYGPIPAVPVPLENKVHVEFFVMSKCPDASRCETVFAPSLIKLSSIINFTLSFIAVESAPYRIECMHGPDECNGNKQQLCIQDMYPQLVFLKYLQCQAKEYFAIPHSGQRCANEVSEGAINWSDVQQCVTSEKSNDLFYRALERTRLARARKSCTMHLNGQLWCIRDGSWVDCKEGNDERSLTRAVCSRYHGASKPAECQPSV